MAKGLPCTWTMTCQHPARFHPMAPEETLAEYPTVCAQHLAEAVRTTAVIHATRDIVVRVA